MDEQILKLGKLEVWLQERIGTSKLKVRNQHNLKAQNPPL